MRKTKSESEKDFVDYILSVGGAIKNKDLKHKLYKILVDNHL